MNNTNVGLKRRNSIPWVVHILLCVAILTIPLVVMYRNGMENYHYYIGYLIRTGILIFLFYINYLFLIDRFLLKKKFVIYILINLILIVGLPYLQHLIFDFVLPPREKIGSGANHGPPLGMRILSEAILNILIVGLSVGLKATQRWYSDSINFETAKATQLEADLKILRSQLNPHFLFNTLNNIYSLIAIDANKAQDSVHRLSNLLRYILYENEQKFVPVNKELEFTQNYIDLMQLRLSPEVNLSVRINNEHCDNEIASLLFITLIENAFKHGITNGAKSFIEIKIDVDNKGVLCTVENSLGEEKDAIESKNSGIGLANLRKRLELLYPDNHKLVIERREKSFFVLLYTGFNEEKS